MADITLSSAVRSNLLSLQNTALLAGQTQERLATGLKVNSALDDPTAFFTASSLNSRAGDLNRLLDSVGNAVQTLEAADNGISAITDLVETAQATARQALQSSTGTTSSVSGTGASVSADAAATVTGTGATLPATSTVTATSALTIPADAAADATGADFDDSTGTNTLADLGISAGETLTISDGTDSVTIEFVTTLGDESAGNVGIQTDGDIADIETAIEAAGDVAGGITVTLAGAGTNAASIQLTAGNTTDSIDISADAGVLANLGLDAVGTGADANNRTLSPNPTLAGITDTLEFRSGPGFSVVETINLATIDSRADLETALADIEGVSASINGSDQLEITAAAGAEFQVAGAAAFGGDFQNAGGDTFSPASAAFAGLVADNATLSINFGSNTNTITFGTGVGQVDTLDDLNTALAGLTGGEASIDANGNITATASDVADSIEIDGSYNADSTFGLTAGTTDPSNTDLTALAGQTLTIQFGDNDVNTITFGSDNDAGEVNTLAELTTALGSIPGAQGTASIDADGNLSVTAADAGDSITIGGAAATFGSAVGTTAAGNSATRAALESQFTELRSQIDQLARDASFNGNNLIDGDSLTVIFNEDNTSSLSVTGVTFDSAGLGISAVATDAFQSDANLNAALDELDGAIATLRTQSSTFGSNLSVVQIREDFTNNLINTLETGAANLTLADTNLEGANLLALQTRQQLSSTALSLASQADQNVLRLF